MTGPVRIDAGAVASSAWRPPPFCRVSWANEAVRSVWEPRFQSARDALEDLAVLRAAEDGRPRLLFARAASRTRLCDLALRLGLALDGLPRREPGRHDVAAGRAARLLLRVGGDDGAPLPASEGAPCEDDAGTDPVWRLARATAGAVPFDDGRGLRLGGGWASNPMLAAVGLCAAPAWPSDFDDGTAAVEGAALEQRAERHGRAAAIGHLREALSWPTSWTCLHGIAEVKTPLFRFVRDAPPTAERHTVHLVGTIMPERAPRGLGFPFNAPVRGGRSGS